MSMTQTIVDVTPPAGGSVTAGPYFNMVGICLL